MIEIEANSISHTELIYSMRRRYYILLTHRWAVKKKKSKAASHLIFCYSSFMNLHWIQFFFPAAGNPVLRKPLPTYRMKSVLQCASWIFKMMPQYDAVIAMRRICWYYWCYSQDFTESHMTTLNIWLCNLTWWQNMWVVMRSVDFAGSFFFLSWRMF